MARRNSQRAIDKRPDETGLYVSFHYRKDKEEDMNA